MIKEYTIWEAAEADIPVGAVVEVDGITVKCVINKGRGCGDCELAPLTPYGFCEVRCTRMHRLDGNDVIFEEYEGN